jgi:hypothetical protein
MDKESDQRRQIFQADNMGIVSVARDLVDKLLAQREREAAEAKRVIRERYCEHWQTCPFRKAPYP